MTWKVKIKRVNNGYILSIPNEPDEEGNEPEEKYNEHLFEFPDNYREESQDKFEAETFVKLCWELAEYFAIRLDKYHDYKLVMEVKKR